MINLLFFLPTACGGGRFFIAFFEKTLNKFTLYRINYRLPTIYNKITRQQVDNLNEKHKHLC